MERFIVVNDGKSIVNVSQLIRIGFSENGVTYDNAHPRQQGGCTTYICHCGIENAEIIFNEIIEFLSSNNAIYNASKRCHELQTKNLSK